MLKWNIAPDFTIERFGLIRSFNYCKKST